MSDQEKEQPITSDRVEEASFIDGEHTDSQVEGGSA